jgi:hypothetical protein
MEGKDPVTGESSPFNHGILLNAKIGYVTLGNSILSFHDFAGINALIYQLQLLRAELHLLTGKPDLPDTPPPDSETLSKVPL